MRVAITIEGQEGVTWEEWQSVALTAEARQFDALLRSDHYFSCYGIRERSSLDALTTLAGLAAVTSKIRLGTLVSPTTFRHPSVLAKSAVTIDHISSGRMELGVGAGWFEAEHRAYGFYFPETAERMTLFEEQVEIIHRSWRQGSFSFEGSHYRIEDLDALPKPVRGSPLPLLIGGAGKRRTIEVAARFGAEYNTHDPSVAELRQRRGRFAEAWKREGRDPADLRFSVMLTLVTGRDTSEVRERTRLLAEWRRQPIDEMVAEINEHGGFIGTIDAAVEHMHAIEDSGVTRVILQHHLHRDLDVLELIGDELIPALGGG